LHTVVRLPAGVFAPYTSIKTNILFFTKGVPTKGVWFYEHPYPHGVTSYNKTKPMQLEEFKAEQAWWGVEADDFKARKPTEQAWKVSADEIASNGYNLDRKNPHKAAAIDHDPEQLLASYQATQTSIQSLRDQLKSILAEALAR
jgi:type I restriction enzyme M protein